MWYQVNSNTLYYAGKVRNELRKLGLKHVIIQKSQETIIQSHPDNALKRDLLRETARINGSTITPTERPDSNWERALCGVEIFSHNIAVHRGKCKECLRLLAPTDVRAIKQQEVNMAVLEATEFNAQQPVKIIKPAEGSPVNALETLEPQLMLLYEQTSNVLEEIENEIDSVRRTQANVTTIQEINRNMEAMKKQRNEILEGL